MSIARKVARSIEALCLPGLVTGIIAGRPLSLSSDRVAHRLKRLAPGLQTVIDVGANEGQFALAVRRYFPTAHIHAFEPVPCAFERLARSSRGDRRIRLYPLALGRRPGRIAFFMNRFSQVSSALPIDPANNHPNYDASAASPIEVSVARLDEVNLESPIARPALLKLDVQGFEAEVLSGARGLLTAIDYILLEVPFVRLYSGAPTFEDLHELLASLGFGPVAPLGFNEGKDGLIIEADMLYRAQGAIHNDDEKF